MGRKKIFTEEAVAKICQAIRSGATVDIAARCGGISKTTLYRWLVYGEKNRKPGYVHFARQFREAEALGALDALTTLRSSITQGDVKSAIWLLSRRHGYKTDSTHEIPEVVEKKKVPQELDYRSVLTTQIAELKESMSKAKESGSWQAYAALQRQMVSLLSELRALDAEEGAIDQYDTMNDEQVLSEIVNTIVALPPILRQRVESDLRSLVGSNVVALKKGS
jgi:transposase-like protein